MHDYSVLARRNAIKWQQCLLLLTQAIMLAIVISLQPPRYKTFNMRNIAFHSAIHNLITISRDVGEEILCHVEFSSTQ